METRSLSEAKYPNKKSPLKFLQKEITEPYEFALKADLLMNAISEKNEKFVKEILESPGDSSYINFQLYGSTIYDPKNKTEIDKNYHPHYSAMLPRTPLTLAVYYGLVNIVELLIQHGADVNLSGQPEEKQSCDYQFTPIEYAVHHYKTLVAEQASMADYKDIVTLLKESGVIISPLVEKLDTAGMINNQLKVTNFFIMKDDLKKRGPLMNQKINSIRI